MPSTAETASAQPEALFSTRQGTYTALRWEEDVVILAAAAARVSRWHRGRTGHGLGRCCIVLMARTGSTRLPAWFSTRQGICTARRGSAAVPNTLATRTAASYSSFHPERTASGTRQCGITSMAKTEPTPTLA